METPPPLMLTFGSGITRLPIPINLLDDDIEEGFETFTLRISSNEAVQILTETASVFIRDDDGKKLT